MKVGDLVKIKDTRYHNEIGVVIKESSPRAVKVHWADERVLWEHTKNLEVICK
jgi:hypothetical protein